jgi:hypothetical protein
MYISLDCQTIFYKDKMRKRNPQNLSKEATDFDVEEASKDLAEIEANYFEVG